MKFISSFIIFSVRREREKQQRRNRKIKETTGRPGREVPGGTGFVFSELRIFCVVYRVKLHHIFIQRCTVGYLGLLFQGKMCV